MFKTEKGYRNEVIDHTSKKLLTMIGCSSGSGGSGNMGSTKLITKQREYLIYAFRYQQNIYTCEIIIENCD